MDAYSTELSPAERDFEAQIRPQRFDEFVGQREVVRGLRIYLAAARGRGEPLDHVLLTGYPGLGKTTLASIINREMGGTLHATSGPAIARPGDLVGLLSKLETNDILFVDEIHRLPAAVQEYLYQAMEDFLVDIVLEAGVHAKSVKLPLQTFTLVGATTREGLLSKPFRDRFGILQKLDPYPPEDLHAILDRTAGILGIGLEPKAGEALARRARGTPRIANRLLRRARDLAQVEGYSEVDQKVVVETMKLLGVDDHGLLETDRRILATIQAAGRPVGLKSLAAAVGESEDTLEEVYEPHLLREGFLVRTPRGREITDKAHRLLGSGGASGGLFS